MSAPTNLPSNSPATGARAGSCDDPTSHGQAHWDGSAWTDHHLPHSVLADAAGRPKKRRRVWMIAGAAVAAVAIGLGGLAAATVATEVGNDLNHKASVSRQAESLAVDFAAHATAATDAMVAGDRRAVRAQLPALTADADKLRSIATSVPDPRVRQALNKEADAIDQLVIGFRDYDQAALQRAMHLFNEAVKEAHAAD